MWQVRGRGLRRSRAAQQRAAPQAAAAPPTTKRPAAQSQPPRLKVRSASQSVGCFAVDSLQLGTVGKHRPIADLPVLIGRGQVVEVHNSHVVGNDHVLQNMSCSAGHMSPVAARDGCGLGGNADVAIARAALLHHQGRYQVLAASSSEHIHRMTLWRGATAAALAAMQGWPCHHEHQALGHLCF